MKDYEVNYVHQDSKTVPDVNHTFETSTKPASNKCSDFIKAQTPPTHKDVLLKRWEMDTEAMARKLIENDLEDGGYFFDSIETKSGRGYTSIYQIALDGEIAYLNSAAEVGK